MLHAGPVRRLAARAEGDLLGVTVHSNASVGKLKGEGRPILTERAHAVLVAAPAAVDQVIVSKETSVKPMLYEFQPDVDACGPDGQSDPILTGALAALGVPPAVVTAKSSHSNTALIARVRRGMNG
jgi:D-beta-D-heptose 7-phosphate kinase/D-beta-D-heptose 1-phosphate adenosyltransferase